MPSAIVLAVAGFGGSPPNEVRRRDASGVWSAVTPSLPSGGLPTTATLRYVLWHPTDPNVAYLIGEDVIAGPLQREGVAVSTDAGLTWGTWSMQALATSTAAMLYSPTVNGSGDVFVHVSDHPHQYIWRVVGGTTWSQIVDEQAIGANELIQINTPLADEQYVAVGRTRVPDSSAGTQTSENSVRYYAVDGSSFSDVTLPTLIDPASSNVIITGPANDTTSLYAIDERQSFQTSGGFGNPPYHLIQVFDGVATSVTPTPFPWGQWYGASRDVIVGPELILVGFSFDTNGMLYSIDGGATFATGTGYPTGTTVSLRDWIDGPPTNLWTIVDGDAWYSTDGGATWASEPIGNASSMLPAVQPSETRRAFIYGTIVG